MSLSLSNCLCDSAARRRWELQLTEWAAGRAARYGDRLQAGLLAAVTGDSATPTVRWTGCRGTETEGAGSTDRQRGSQRARERRAARSCWLQASAVAARLRTAGLQGCRAAGCYTLRAGFHRLWVWVVGCCCGAGAGELRELLACRASKRRLQAVHVRRAAAGQRMKATLVLCAGVSSLTVSQAWWGTPKLDGQSCFEVLQGINNATGAAHSLCLCCWPLCSMRSRM
jgi:hypothetical protein